MRIALLGVDLIVIVVFLVIPLPNRV